MRTPNKRDEARATTAAKTLCEIIAKYELKCAQFDMKVDNGPFEGMKFTVTIESIDPSCLCEDCLNDERDTK